MKSICGADCSQCAMQAACKGCLHTNGRPFGGDCVAADCCHARGYRYCAECTSATCACKAKLMQEFNTLHIPDMPPVTELFSLNGSYVNLSYPLPNGQTVKLLKDENVYFGTQLPKANGDRCYGLIADAAYLLISEYGENGADPIIVLFKKR